MLRPGFDLNCKVIGLGGSCTKGIFDATGAKVRLRGRGSKHLEQGGREADTHLMLAVAVERGELENFAEAFRMAVKHLRGIERRFHSFCRQQGLSPPKGPCFWIGEMPEEGRKCLGAAVEGLSPPEAAGSRKGSRSKKR